MPPRPAGMSGVVADLLVDTDVCIDHLRGAHAFKPRDHRVHYSVITRAELLAGSAATDAVNILPGPFRELAVSRLIAERAGELRTETGVRLPDALIAATAIEEALALLTRNRGDFTRIRGVRLHAP